MDRKQKNRSPSASIDASSKSRGLCRAANGCYVNKKIGDQMSEQGNPIPLIRAVSPFYFNTVGDDSLINFIEIKPARLVQLEYKNPLKVFIYNKENDLRQSAFDKWCDYVASININFNVDFIDSATDIIKHESVRHHYKWGSLIERFMGAVKDYKTRQSELEKVHEISNESARWFLFLMPTLINHETNVHIDSSNGNFNIDIRSKDKGILSSQISGNGYVYYSYVRQKRKIYKITGTAKYKDAKDTIDFIKIINML